MRVVIVSAARVSKLIGLMGGFKFPLMTDELMMHQQGCPKVENNGNRWPQSPANDESDPSHKPLRSLGLDGNLTQANHLGNFTAQNSTVPHL